MSRTENIEVFLAPGYVRLVLRPSGGEVIMTADEAAELAEALAKSAQKAANLPQLKEDDDGIT